MKKISTFLIAAFVFFGLSSVAQTNTACNADFTFTISQNTVYFFPVANADSALIKHYWNFGDGVTVSGYAVSHTYTSPGTYSVLQSIYKSGTAGQLTCFDTVRKTVVIPQTCKIPAAFSFTRDSIQTNVLHFYYSTSLANISALWHFGDSTSSTDINPIHTFTKSGLYNVCLSVVVNGICKGDTCLQVQVQVPTTVCNNTPYFIATVDSLQYNKFHFTNYSSPAITSADSVSWTFGDGTTSQSHDINFVHTYSLPGTYNVCLFIKKQATNTTASCAKEICKTIVVQQVCNLVADFNWHADSLTFNKVYFANASITFAAGDSIRWSFGDNSSSTDLNPTHIYNNAGTYTVCLRIAKAGFIGTSPCVKEICKTITITQNTCVFVPGYTWINDSVNSYKINFTNTSTGLNSTDSVKWSFGDNTPMGISFNASHIYTQAGKYYVCMIVYHGNNCVKYKCDSVTVTAPVTTCNNTPYFVFSTDSLKYNTIHFTNYSSPAIAVGDSVSWTFGDGTTSQSHDINLVHTYNQPGTYNVCLFIKKQANSSTASCAKEICKTITVTAPVTCDFVPTYKWVKDSLNSYKINFTNTTTGLNSTDSVKWNFGDGYPYVTSFNPSHVYANAGKYYVCLIVYHGTNCVKYKCDSVAVTANVIPCEFTPSYTWKSDSVNKKKIYFTNTSNVPTTINSSVVWSFGDGTSATGWNATHEYTLAGKYYVCLRVETSAICVKYKCDSITVPDNVVPCDFTPNYTWKVDSLNNKKINFTNTSIIPVTANILITWSFGDGSTATGWNATHEYIQPGKYYVCLKIQTTNTCYKYKCDSVVVPVPVVNNCFALSYFTIYKAALDNQLYYFAPSYPATDVHYTWTFGDGTGSQSATTSHHYAKAGTYTACLTAFRNADCATTTCKTINVLQSYSGCDTAAVRFEYKKDPVIPNKVNFYLISNVAVSQQSWTIGKMITGAVPVTLNQSNPYYYFADTGYYRVCVRVVTLNGCVKEYCDVIHIDAVLTPCVLQAYPNPAYSQITLNVQLSDAGTIHGEIYNVQNLLIRKIEQQGLLGNNIVTINIQDLASGFYTLRLVYGNNICYAKFQKF